MMGHRQVEQAALFYEFSLEKHIPADHLLRSIDRFVDLHEIKRDLAPLYSNIGRPSIDPEAHDPDAADRLLLRHPI
jgi:transposase